MYHDNKRVYDFFKYYFNKIFRSLLESDTSVESGVLLEYGRGECDTCTTVGFGENIGTPDAYCSTTKNIPPIMFIAISPSPSNISGGDKPEYRISNHIGVVEKKLLER